MLKVGRGRRCCNSLKSTISVPVSGTIEILRPAGRTGFNWEEVRHTRIDEAVEQPASGDGSTVYWDKNNEAESQDWDFDATSHTTITKLTLWILSDGTMDDGDTTFFMKMTGGLSSGVMTFEAGDTNEWKSLDWTGSWTQAQVNTLEVEGLSPASIGGGNEGHFDVFYIEATGT